MDKKNTTIGVLLLVAAFAGLWYTSPKQPLPPASTSEATPANAPATALPGSPSTTLAATPAPAAATATFAALANDKTDATITTLGNDYVELRLTDFGGAISNVAFKKYPAHQNAADPFIFNEVHAAPILAFQFPGLDQNTRFQRVSATATEVVYRALFENRIEVTRRYTIHATGDTSGDPYRIRHETTFRNLTDQSAPLPNLLSLGTTALVSPNDNGLYLNVASFDGEKANVTERADLAGGGFMSMIGFGDSTPKPTLERTEPVVWAAVKNQFFASLFTPEKPGTGVVVRRVELPPLPGSTQTNIGLTSDIRLDIPVLAANATTTFSGDLYIGPKEYTRLSKFSHSEDKVMQYDRYFFNRIFFSGYVAPFMNWLMNSTHTLVRDWGVAIVLMTLLLKIVSLPFTLAASKSAKRMQKLQPLMQAVREKYKDNPQKLNQATMELFKEHKVNPMGGCIPILITIPLFIGFFAMLQGTAELRFQSFLWAHDLSAPDTIARIGGIPINIMPLLMGITMFFQMKLTPSPTTDNTQAKIMQFMPFVFTLICYNFSCALALYSTINGLFTIGQQLVVNKYAKNDPTPTPLGVPSGTGQGGKKLKNVTPKK